MRAVIRSALIYLPMLIGVATAPLVAQQTKPTNVTATLTGPTTVLLKWTAAATATRYWVRQAEATGAFSNIPSPAITGTEYTVTGLTPGKTVRYEVMARLSSGVNTYSGQVSVTPPAEPSNMASTPPGPSSSGQSTTPQAGQAVMTLAPLSPTLVAQQTVPKNRAPLKQASPDARFGPVAAEVPSQPTSPSASNSPPAATSGRYRVVANGFSVVQQAHSHHDDVYGGFIMLHFNRQTGELLDRDARHTKVLGDINGRVFGETDGGSFNRFRAGTANPSGGLKNGDSYPDASHARFRGQDGAPPNRETFPFEIWTGDLANASDAVVILPTLWSRDGKIEPYDTWQNAELTAGSQIWYDQAVQQALHQTTLGVVAPPGAVTPNGNQQFAQLAQLVGAAILGGMGQPWALAFAFDPSAHDFPIGLDPRSKSLPRRAIVLTREMIEQALSSPPAPLSPTMLVPNYPAWILGYLTVPVGVIPVLLFDYVPPPGEPLRTAYVMYLQVERM